LPAPLKPLLSCGILDGAGWARTVTVGVRIPPDRGVIAVGRSDHETAPASAAGMAPRWATDRPAQRWLLPICCLGRAIQERPRANPAADRGELRGFEPLTLACHRGIPTATSTTKPCVGGHISFTRRLTSGGSCGFVEQSCCAAAARNRLSCISPTVGTKFISPAQGWSPYLRVDAAKVWSLMQEPGQRDGAPSRREATPRVRDRRLSPEQRRTA
jgi:hypothetical protein